MAINMKSIHRPGPGLAGLYDESQKDWLYPVEYNPGSKPAFKPLQWNNARVECIGTSIRTF